MDMRDQYGNRVGQMDAYGNPIQQTDAYGNPLHTHQGQQGHVTSGYATVTEVYGTGAGGQPQMMLPEQQRHGGGMLHRSSSSSSSEDDGMGGRRKKKGIKEKIREKLPGGHKTDEYGQGHGPGYGQTTAGYGGTTTMTTTTTTATGIHHEPEKKGMMEKIKEKLPGHH